MQTLCTWLVKHLVYDELTKANDKLQKKIMEFIV